MKNPVKSKGLLLNLLLMTASFLFIFSIIEAGVRIVYFQKESATLDEAVRLGKIGGGEFNKKALIKHNVGLAHIIRISNNERIIYELMPNISAYSAGSWVRTNKMGFRDKEYSHKKTGNVIRIVGLGDSIMFGQGALGDSIYLTHLEYNLNHTHKNNSIEIINMAVPGYNTAMEVETLKEKGLAFKPDIVILGFTGNDFCLPNFIRTSNNYFTLRRSYLFDLIENRGKILVRSRYHHLPLLQHADFSICKENEAPDKYRTMVGETAVLNSLKELSSLSHNNDFKVIVVFWGTPRDTILKATSELGFYIFETEPKLTEYMKNNNITNYKQSKLAVSESDGHPSNTTHKLIAKWLQEFIEKNDISDLSRTIH